MGKCRKVSGIYAITNKVNGKKYIGYSESIIMRWNNHKYRLRRSIGHCTHLQAAWNVYGESSFDFSIIEILPIGLSKKEYEAIETKWVLHYNSHLSEYGYNGVLPGSIPLYRQDENITRHIGNSSVRPFTEYVCINMNTQEIVKVKGTQEAMDTTGLKSISKVTDLASHWENKCKKKSLYGWIIVRENIYDPEFDYIGYKKIKGCKDSVKKTWRDYYHKVSPEDIIPREDRNLKRIPIVAVNIETGEEKQYKMLKNCYNEFNSSKVYKCINAPYGKYKHRGYYFRKL